MVKSQMRLSTESWWKGRSYLIKGNYGITLDKIIKDERAMKNAVVV